MISKAKTIAIEKKQTNIDKIAKDSQKENNTKKNERQKDFFERFKF